MEKSIGCMGIINDLEWDNVSMKTLAPYGTWKSTLTGDYIAQASIKLSEPAYHNGDCYWLEGRPSEKGRQTLVRRRADGTQQDLLEPPWNARTKAHEYGGGCYCLGEAAAYFCHNDDQQIYRIDLVSLNITPVTKTSQHRYADLQYDPRHQRLLAVCEDHSTSGEEPKNRLISIELNGYEQTIIDDNHDFISTPRSSPCGRWLTYLTWDHPDMPWDASQLWLCAIDENGRASPPQLVAGTGHLGNHAESIFQPQWSPAGELFWVSDSSDWWNIYTLGRTAIERFWQLGPESVSPTAVYSHDAEYATPQWVFNMSTYGFLGPDEIFATYTQQGVWHLLRLQRSGSIWRPVEVQTDLVYTANISCHNGKAIFVGGGRRSPLALYEFTNDTVSPMDGPADVPLDAEGISTARSFSFPTGKDETAHAFFYPPANVHYRADTTDLPPVIVIGHGGPTGATDPSFSYKIQFWTQRGFAIVDVNYRGSTGFGRQYRQTLQKQWGVVDVQDLCAAAEYATSQGWVHPQQRIIRGSSAGGYSVLAALTDMTTFNAGVTLYGIGDLETLATDTHKFESRYLDGLIGPYPGQQALYRQRSPIHKVAQIQCPVLVFQGKEDKVVPVNQAEEIVAAVKAQGLPVAYVLYPEEGHGFRQSKTIAHQLQAELFFYQQVFALHCEAKSDAFIHIDNWELR